MTQEKMKIQHRAETYEGIRSIFAVGMAMFESSGLRRLIDQRCRYDPAKRVLSPGMVVKALIGPMLDTTNKYPLYMVNEAYGAAPADRIFGPGVSNEDLYDVALARGLDSLFDADLTALFAECSETIVRKYGLDSRVFHVDATDVSFTGMEHLPDKEDAAVPVRNGHPKDLHFELLQYELQVATDSNRILRYMRPYSGNTGDCEMDSDTIDALASAFPDRKGITVVGDCKLASSANIAKMIDCGFGFVSKCAENFKGNTKKKIAEQSLRAAMHPCGEDGLAVGDFDSEVELSEGRKERLRFIAFRREGKILREAEKIRAWAERKSEDISEGFVGKRYMDEKNAMAAVAKVLPGEGSPYLFDVKLLQYSSDSPCGRGWWEAKLTPVISEKNVRTEAERRATAVLVTNLRRPGDDADDGVIQASDCKVLELYNREYKVEQSFRLMKSGMGMDSIYLQTPSRENAMMFAVSIAVLISNVADAMFRKHDVTMKKKRLTMHRLAYYLSTTNVEYSRGENELRLRGPSAVTDRFFDITDTVKINPQHLLGYLSD